MGLGVATLCGMASVGGNHPKNALRPGLRNSPRSAHRSVNWKHNPQRLAPGGGLGTEHGRRGQA